MREGFALIAVNQYRLATKALKIALELDPEYVRSRFRLEDLYGDNRLAKTSHLELFAREALENPSDGDLLFLVGMSLYADGEVDRASRFFAKAAELGGAEAVRLLTPVLGKAAPPEVVPAAPRPTRRIRASTSESICHLMLWWDDGISSHRAGCGARDHTRSTLQREVAVPPQVGGNRPGMPTPAYLPKCAVRIGLGTRKCAGPLPSSIPCG